MVSDDEIVSLALQHRERVTSGRASIASAGEDLMRALLKSPPLPAVSYEDEVPRTPPGVIGN
jgi:hypothetical protein